MECLTAALRELREILQVVPDDDIIQAACQGVAALLLTTARAAAAESEYDIT